MIQIKDLKTELDEIKSILPKPRLYECPFYDECQAGPYTRQSTLNGGYQQIDWIQT